jgi:ABC-type Fe3+-siderophore transport system permease subunit
MITSPYDLIYVFCILLVLLYVLSFLYVTIHEIIVRIYIIFKLDTRHKFKINWEICLPPIINTIAVYASLDYWYYCIKNKESYIGNTAEQYYDNNL